MTKRTKKIWVAALAVTVVAAVVWAKGSGTVAETGDAYPPVKVALATVGLNDAPRAFTGVGALEAERQVMVAAEAGGKVTKIAFNSGQYVKAGQLLVQLNDATEQADRMRLQAQVQQAQSHYQRLRQLVAEDAATKEQLEAATAQLHMAQGELQRVYALIAQKAIRAPFAGMMGIRQINVGQYLNSGDAVASLVDAQVLRVNFALDEQAVSGLALAQQVTVSVDAYPDEALQAKVTAIDPLIGDARTVQVQATMANPEGRLKAGMFAKVQVQQGASSAVLTVPESAITYTAYGDSVFVAAANADQRLTVKRVSVTVGERWQGMVEVKQGLSQNQRVVTSGQLKLTDGMVVEALAQDTLNATPAQPEALLPEVIVPSAEAAPAAAETAGA
ncbi:MAG: efflux RND transporter periplasmic adaptor subunit [Neisseriaceae bacterium]|nr:efflux RND transporter periplasmic adaptor subunit [Neisseriaceae bacterium]